MLYLVFGAVYSALIGLFLYFCGMSLNDSLSAGFVLFGLISAAWFATIFTSPRPTVHKLPVEDTNTTQRITLDPFSTLDGLVEEAARKLPPGWIICLAVEKHAGWILLTKYDSDPIRFPSNHESIQEEFADALEYALTDGKTDDPTETHPRLGGA